MVAFFLSRVDVPTANFCPMITPHPTLVSLALPGEICGFRVHGQDVPFEVVLVNRSTGEGTIRAKERLDCELQKEHTFTIQAYDCGEGPDGSNIKRSHK